MTGLDETRLWNRWYEQALKELGMDEVDAEEYADLRVRNYVDKQRDHMYLGYLEGIDDAGEH